MPWSIAKGKLAVARMALRGDPPTSAQLLGLIEQLKKEENEHYKKPSHAIVLPCQRTINRIKTEMELIKLTTFKTHTSRRNQVRELFSKNLLSHARHGSTFAIKYQSWLRFAHSKRRRVANNSTPLYLST